MGVRQIFRNQEKASSLNLEVRLRTNSYSEDEYIFGEISNVFSSFSSFASPSFIEVINFDCRRPEHGISAPLYSFGCLLFCLSTLAKQGFKYIFMKHINVKFFVTLCLSLGRFYSIKLTASKFQRSPQAKQRCILTFFLLLPDI